MQRYQDVAVQLEVRDVVERLALVKRTGTGGAVTSYKYDPLSRLVEARRSDGSTEAFAYDPMGNILTHSGPDGMVRSKVNSAHQIESAGDTRFEYDANGNMIRRMATAGTTQYRYDDFDRLREVALAVVDGHDDGDAGSHTGRNCMAGRGRTHRAVGRRGHRVSPPRAGLLQGGFSSLEWNATSASRDLAQYRERFCRGPLPAQLGDAPAAICAGADHAQGTINGVGERCGNMDLLPLIANLRLKYNLDCLAGGAASLKHLTEVSRYVYEIANMNFRGNQPFVGASAFAHKAGLHTSAISRRNSLSMPTW